MTGGWPSRPTTWIGCSRGSSRSPLHTDLASRILARTSGRARVRWGLWVMLAVGAGLTAALLAAVSGYLTGQELSVRRLRAAAARTGGR